MDVRGYGDMLSLAFARTQSDLETATKRLSSGLRIQSAQDDPSGLAISESLQAKVNGLDQGVQNVQAASNALTVADGALETITALLQRMRTLVVAGRSDLLSASDRDDVQAEIGQLILEINRVAQNTSFNGRTLLDGSLSAALPQPPRVILPVNDKLGAGGTVIDTILDPGQPQAAYTAQPFTQQLTVTGYDPSANQLTVQVDIASSDPTFGGHQSATFTVDAGTNYGTGGFPPTPGSPTFYQSDAQSNFVLSFNIGTLTAADVGRTSLLYNLPPIPGGSGHPLEVNTGAGEGSIVSISLAAVDARTLGVSGIALSSDDLVNAGNEYRIDNALETITAQRATLGAEIVSLHETADNANIASANYASAESAIRDIAIGSETVEFTKAQIRRAIQTQLTASIEQLQLGLVQLVSASILGA